MARPENLDDLRADIDTLNVILERAVAERNEALAEATAALLRDRRSRLTELEGGKSGGPAL